MDPPVLNPSQFRCSDLSRLKVKDSESEQAVLKLRLRARQPTVEAAIELVSLKLLEGTD